MVQSIKNHQKNKSKSRNKIKTTKNSPSQSLLLMEEIPNNHLGFVNPVDNGINYQPQLVSLAGFLVAINSTTTYRTSPTTSTNLPANHHVVDPALLPTLQCHPGLRTNQSTEKVVFKVFKGPTRIPKVHPCLKHLRICVSCLLGPSDHKKPLQSALPLSSWEAGQGKLYVHLSVMFDLFIKQQKTP